MTSGFAQRTVNMAQVFAEQARAAGVTVNLRKITSTDFLGSEFLKRPFAQDFWTGQPFNMGAFEKLWVS